MRTLRTSGCILRILTARGGGIPLLAVARLRRIGVRVRWLLIWLRVGIRRREVVRVRVRLRSRRRRRWWHGHSQGLPPALSGRLAGQVSIHCAICPGRRAGNRSALTDIGQRRAICSCRGHGLSAWRLHHAPSGRPSAQPAGRIGMRWTRSTVRAVSVVRTSGAAVVACWARPDWGTMWSIMAGSGY